MKAGPVLLLILACCSPEASTPCAGRCASDPYPRCVSLDACERDSDCARGLTCTDGLCRVVIDRAPSAQHELQNGFGVRQPMEVRLDNTGTIVRWVQPNSDSKEVHCALFGCLPQVLEVNGVRVIENYEKCALLETNIMAAAQGDFSLFDRLQTRAPQHIDATGCAGPFPVTRALVTDLLVGCLAYGTSSLVAVSDLVPVAPGDLRGQVGDVPASATCTTDFAPCVPAELTRSGFGTCLGPRCRARCQTPDDCKSLSKNVAWTCQLDPFDPAWQRVGACVEATP